VSISRLRVRELVRKEFIQLFRDPKNRGLLFIAPLLQILLFGYVVSTDVRHVTVAFLDQAKTRESRMLEDAFSGNKIFRVIYYPQSSAQMEELLLRRKVDLVVKVPPDFSASIRKGKTAAVQILADGSLSNMAAVRIAYVSQVLDRVNRQLLTEIYPMKLDYGQIDLRTRTWYNPNLESREFFVPGIVALLILIVCLLFTSMAIIKEKEVGTMEQLIVTPLKAYELILGKTIPYAIISVGQMAVVTTFAVFWFDIPMVGSVLLLSFATCLFLLSTLGIGIFISTIAATQQQAMMTTFFFMIPFFMLSGFVFPIANMPQFVQWLTYLDPLRYMLIIVRGIFLKGAGFHILWPQLLGLTILGIIVFGGAVARFRKRLD
jgi:ABC-2 type transport system permease protein